MAERQRKEKALGALEVQIMELWGNINAATARFLELVAEFDRKEGWAQHGMASCAQWLSWQCGIGRVAATEKVRTARALESLPKISEAFGEGRLSYSKVRALTRVATVETEETLLHIALNGTAAHVERTVRGFRRVKRYLERDEAEALYDQRHLLCWRESDGSVTLNARLTPEVGELLFKALDAAQAQLEERSEEAVKTEPPIPVDGSVSAETPSPGFGQRRVHGLRHRHRRAVPGGGPYLTGRPPAQSSLRGRAGRLGRSDGSNGCRDCFWPRAAPREGGTAWTQGLLQGWSKRPGGYSGLASSTRRTTAMGAASPGRWPFLRMLR
ncbi:MAG: DUF222 domain-containing protein [Gammaproteobacteria bacterium]|nr:DUF222 domain-containing protein [Gammaproteobacteria bacterium]